MFGYGKMANFAKKMKKLITLTTALAVAFAQISCEDISLEGPQVDGIRSVSSFEKIELKFKGDVFFSQSDTREINVKTAQNLQSYILTEVKGNTLILDVRSNTNIKDGDVNIYVSNPTLSGIVVSGNGDFKSQTAVNTNSMNIRMSGNGNLSLPKLTSNSLDADISGNGNLSIGAGKLAQQNVKLSARGNYTADKMETNDATVRTTGRGSAWVWAKDKLNATITGRGDIWYQGNPQINSSVSGAGKVIQL